MVSLCWGGPWPPWAHIQLPSTAYPWYAQALPEASHTPPLYCMGFSMLSLSGSNSQSGLTLSICQLFYNPSGEGQYWLGAPLNPREAYSRRPRQKGFCLLLMVMNGVEEQKGEESGWERQCAQRRMLRASKMNLRNRAKPAEGRKPLKAGVWWGNSWWRAGKTEFKFLIIVTLILLQLSCFFLILSFIISLTSNLIKYTISPFMDLFSANTCFSLSKSERGPMSRNKESGILLGSLPVLFLYVALLGIYWSALQH